MLGGINLTNQHILVSVLLVEVLSDLLVGGSELLAVSCGNWFDWKNERLHVDILIDNSNGKRTTPCWISTRMASINER